jgi:hypothetical protein
MKLTASNVKVEFDPKWLPADLPNERHGDRRWWIIERDDGSVAVHIKNVGVIVVNTKE